jgi:predicted secreted hydrolase
MVKLSKFVWLCIFVCLCLIGAYFAFIFEGPSTSESNDNIFGRNVYEQNMSIGSKADSSYSITFPEDHREHTKFDIEWWYLTANLEDNNGAAYGLQWTLFRFRAPGVTNNQTNNWHNNQLYMAHASIHSLDTHWFSEKFARGGVGNAGQAVSPFSLFIDNWQWLNTEDNDELFPSTLIFDINNTSRPFGLYSASFTMQRTGPFIKHGLNGYSVKSLEDHASHYYSAPFINIAGVLRKNDNTDTEHKISLKGKAWFDHEWTSQLLDDKTLGWDWLSIHLDSGSKIMAFRMRLKNQKDYVTGSYISETGEQTTLLENDLTLRPLANTEVEDRLLPLQWRLVIPSKQIDLSISAIKNEQWNSATIPYYEGMVIVEGTHSGEGFVELTGY